MATLKREAELVVIEEKKLSRTETRRLDELESIIEANFKGFVAVGMALAEIRDQRLYRKQYKTFEEYCQNIWDVHYRRANQLIEASKVVENVKKLLHENGKNFSQKELPLPANDAQARVLANLPPEEQVEVWQEVVARATQNGGKVTASKVRKAVKERRGEKLQQAIKKVSSQKKEEGKRNGKKMSEAFEKAWETLWQQVEEERQTGWRYTSKSVVYERLSLVLEALEEDGLHASRGREDA